MRLPHLFERVVRSFQRFQGIGRKSAERFLFDIVSHWSVEAIEEFSKALSDIARERETCSKCNAALIFDENRACVFCRSERTQKGVMAVVGSIKDLFSLESTEQFNGSYFVLGGLLSPLDQRGVDDATLELLWRRIQEEGVQELLIALDNSPEGEATSHYITQILKSRLSDTTLSHPFSITALATGVPVGSSIEFLDKSTLGRAVLNRVKVT